MKNLIALRFDRDKAKPGSTDATLVGSKPVLALVSKRKSKQLFLVRSQFSKLQGSKFVKISLVEFNLILREVKFKYMQVHTQKNSSNS